MSKERDLKIVNYGNLCMLTFQKYDGLGKPEVLVKLTERLGCQIEMMLSNEDVKRIKEFFDSICGCDKVGKKVSRQQVVKICSKIIKKVEKERKHGKR